jgi:beta-glucosidase
MAGQFSRRDFVKLAGLSAFGMAATPAKPADGESKPAPDRHAVPVVNSIVLAVD